MAAEKTPNPTHSSRKDPQPYTQLQKRPPTLHTAAEKTPPPPQPYTQQQKRPPTPHTAAEKTPQPYTAAEDTHNSTQLQKRLKLIDHREHSTTQA